MNAAQPFYTARNGNATLNAYQSVGSGAGIADIVKGLVNFGASDVPMKQSDITANGSSTPISSFLQVPIDLGGIGISYNVKGLKTGLVLNATVLANIYLGKITKWNNSAIKALNPKVVLPNKPIVVVARADKSGTTFIYTDFLHTAAPTVWTTAPSKSPLKLPTGGIAGTGNGGVANAVSSTPNSIGYIEYSYILLNGKLAGSVAKIKNASGVALAPTIAGIQADAAAKPAISSVNFSIVYQKGTKAYPISGYTWAIVVKKQTNDVTGTLLVKYLDWLTHTGTTGAFAGQHIAAEQAYVALPANIQALARNTLLAVVGTHNQKLLTTH
jgi:phosphate transport system substrate-binding protein